MSKTFTHAGVSTLDGVTKVRFCNDALRQKVLIKNGHTNIDIIELLSPMLKEDIVAYLISIDFAQGNATVQSALEQELDKRSPKAANKERKGNKETKKPKKAPAPKPSMESIRAKASTAISKSAIEAQLADLEDAPY
jgi:hypothetical protein